jgi:hypothetical protein
VSLVDGKDAFRDLLAMPLPEDEDLPENIQQFAELRVYILVSFYDLKRLP